MRNLLLAPLSKSKMSRLSQQRHSRRHCKSNCYRWLDHTWVKSTPGANLPLHTIRQGSMSIQVSPVTLLLHAWQWPTVVLYQESSQTYTSWMTPVKNHQVIFRNAKPLKRLPGVFPKLIFHWPTGLVVANWH